MAIVNPVGYLHNVATHTAQVDRLASLGLILPSSATELRARGGVRMPGDFKVTAQATPNMSINVAPGICYVPASTSAAGTYDVPNDAALVVSVTAAHASLNRNDLVVARVQDSFYSGSTNTGDVIIVPGTAAATPTDPALPVGAVYTILARIVVRAGTTSILNTDITMLATPIQLTGGIKNVVAGDVVAGLFDGQYRDHPTLGLQRWDATSSTWWSVANPRPSLLALNTGWQYARQVTGSPLYERLHIAQQGRDVKIRGAIANTASITASTPYTIVVAGTIPALQRPPVQIIRTAASIFTTGNWYPHHLDVLADGSMVMTPGAGFGAGTFFSIDLDYSIDDI